MKTIIEKILKDFEPTGEISPANGICYIDKKNDHCAILYNNSKKLRIFTERKEQFINREMWPCFYNNVVTYSY